MTLISKLAPMSANKNIRGTELTRTSGTALSAALVPDAFAFSGVSAVAEISTAVCLSGVCHGREPAL
jgi:hypothetical protein